MVLDCFHGFLMLCFCFLGMFVYSIVIGIFFFKGFRCELKFLFGF